MFCHKITPGGCYTEVIGSSCTLVVQKRAGNQETYDLTEVRSEGSGALV